MAGLMVLTGNPPGQWVDLSSEETVIGRLPTCGVLLDSNGVSRKHARVRRDGEQYFVMDLESRNKTKLNERELSPLQEIQLKEGDRINICDVEMVFYRAYLQKTEALAPSTPEDIFTVTEGGEGSTLHTLDASRSSQQVVSVRPEVKLRAILEITRHLSSNIRLDSVTPKILDALMEIFPQAERVFLALMKDAEGKWSIRQLFHRIRAKPTRGGALGGLRSALGRPDDEARMSISRTIINHVLGQRKAVLSQDAGSDAALPTSASIADLKIRSIMCVPLLTPDGEALGILQLDTSDRKQFGQDDLDVLLAVASQAAIAIQNASMHEAILARERLERDLRLAEQIQKRFLPLNVPQVSGFEFFAHYHAAYEVGGDYYDFVPLPGGRWAVAVADVAGKGVSAALMMAKFSGDTRYCILTEDAPAPAAQALNELLFLTGIDEKFITLCLGVLDPATNAFTFCSAGHTPVLVRRADGSVEEIGEASSGFPLGIMPDTVYNQVQTTLNKGDVVVLYSDGVTDARNTDEELYESVSNRRLKQRVADSPGGPEALGKSVLQAIREFSAGHSQADDITLVCLGPV